MGKGIIKRRELGIDNQLNNLQEIAQVLIIYAGEQGSIKINTR